MITMSYWEWIFSLNIMLQLNVDLEESLLGQVYINNEFNFVGKNHRKQKMIISSIKARKMLLSSCQGFLASVVDTTLEDKVKLEDILIV